MSFKVLGQVSPTANTNTTLYTVPAGMQTVTSTLWVCNRGISSSTVRVAVRPAGEAIENKHYLVMDYSVPPKTTDEWTTGLTLAATDVVTVFASSSDFSFSLFGDES